MKGTRVGSNTGLLGISEQVHSLHCRPSHLRVLGKQISQGSWSPEVSNLTLKPTRCLRRVTAEPSLEGSGRFCPAICLLVEERLDLESLRTLRKLCPTLGSCGSQRSRPPRTCASWSLGPGQAREELGAIRVVLGPEMPGAQLVWGRAVTSGNRAPWDIGLRDLRFEV